MKKNKLTKGFTLIELLVVIAIIGILGAIIYAPFQSARRKGRDSQRVVEMKNLISSLALYADSHKGFYPCSLQVLQDSQSEVLPKNANLSDEYDNTKYNYVGYGEYGDNKDSTNPSGCIDTGISQQRISGFHLWTHLETANGALSGAAKCIGVGSGATNCINFSNNTNVIYSVGGKAYSGGDTTYAGEAKVNFLQSNRSGDTDSVCATDDTYCILDYHQ